MASFAASALATPVQRQAVGWRGTICPLPRASPSRPARSEGATCSGEPSTSAAGSDRKYAVASSLRQGLAAALAAAALAAAPLATSAPALAAASAPPAVSGPVDPNSPLNLSVDDLLKLRKLFDRAFDLTNVGNFEEAEKVWTEIIGMVPDRAEGYSNRGNARTSQNKLELALADYSKAIELEPGAIDPYLNRGVALEGLGRFEEAIKSYDKVLSMDSNDPVVRPRPHHPYPRPLPLPRHTLSLSPPLPSLPPLHPPSPAWNNRGNANAGLGRWEKALSDYERATKIAKDFVFARANYALALYETGRTGEAVGIFRGLTAKYQGFADMSAALAAGLAASGQLDEADRQWEAALSTDPRYADLDWLRTLPRPVLPFQPPQALQLPLSFPLARSA
eukprot:tig00000073_g1752.t1